MKNKKNILGVFEHNPKALKNYLNIREILLKNNEDHTFVEKCYSEFIKRKVKTIKSQNNYGVIKCHECNSNKVFLYKVNTTRCNQIADKSIKTQCICSECGEEFFSKLTIQELRKIYNTKK